MYIRWAQQQQQQQGNNLKRNKISDDDKFNGFRKKGMISFWILICNNVMNYKNWKKGLNIWP